MKSHELAKLLLDLPNEILFICKAYGGSYVSTYENISDPWIDVFNNIRIEIAQDDQAKAEQIVGKE